MTHQLTNQSQPALPLPDNETERLAALHRYKILDTPPEAAFDRITRLAAQIFNLPIAIISLVDASRAWFKSCIGFEAQEVPRDATICSFAILSDEPLIVPDTRQDDRMSCNPLVQAEPGVRFYAGAPLISHDGFNLGTLCLLDSQPHEPFTPQQQAMLVDLAAMVVDELELRLAATRIAQTDAALMQITQGVASVTGEAFIEALVQHFAKVLDMDYVYVGLIEGDRLQRMRTIAVCAHGQIADNLEYLLEETPCWEVIHQRKICCYPRDVQGCFPHAPLLQPLSVESYIATPFFDSNGTAIGLLGMMDGKPLEQVHLAESLLTIFAERVATEIERQRAEQKRELFFAVSSDLQVIADDSGYFRWVSPAFERILGWTEDEMVSRPWIEFVHPDDINASVAEAANLLEGKKTYQFENRYRHKDGSYRWFLWNAQPHLEEQAIYGAAVDITDRKQAEAALHEAHVQLEAALVAGAVYTWCWNIPQNRLVVNAAFANLFNVDTAAAVTAGLPIELFIDSMHAEDRDRVSAAIQQAIATGEVYKAEYRVITAAGAERWVSARGQVEYDAAGKPTAFPGALADITERKRAEEDRDRFFLLSRDMLAIATTDGYFLQVNPVWAKTLGYKTEELMAQPYLDLVHPDDRAATIAEAQKLAEGVPTIDFENRYRCRDGSYRWMSWSVAPFAQQNLLYAVARDVTDRKQAEAERERLLIREQKAREAAEQANRVKDEFLAVLSHELRSPLNPILGWTRLLQGGKLDSSRQSEALATIERNARLQTQLIEDLLDISRIMQGKLSLTVAPVDLAFVITAAIETVRLAAEAKQIQLLLDLDSIVAPISGDAARLQQVVWNLLSNAVKFTPSGGRVVVKLEQGEEAGEQGSGGVEERVRCRFARITVSDTGKGISPQFLPHVFEYFRQEDGSTTRRFGGLGLGLAIVRQIVELHGGTVEAESRGEGLGAIFTVTLPLQSPLLTSSPDRLLDSASLDLAGVRVLVVDDESDSREFVAFVLEQAGATVTTAASARAGWTVLTQSPPDLLLSDIGMPDMDGYTLMRQVRSLPPEQGGQIKAVALSAYAGEVNSQQAMAAGYQQHLSKPIEPAELVQTIAQILQGE